METPSLGKKEVMRLRERIESNLCDKRPDQITVDNVIETAAIFVTFAIHDRGPKQESYSDLYRRVTSSEAKHGLTVCELILFTIDKALDVS